jgi:ankyrin repeat protein
MIARGVDIHSRNSRGRTPTQCFCIWDQREAVQMLLEAGASLKPLCNAIGVTHGAMIDLIQRFIVRELHCQSAALAWLALGRRRHAALNRDTARLIARAVWQSRRREEWQDTI